MHSGRPTASVKTIARMREVVESARERGEQVALVPTMGALHEGHLSLIRTARSENDLVGVSVFVNPTQFERASDLERYPRDLSADTALARGAGADVVFGPSPIEMYPPGFSTWVEVEGLTEGLCGASRPGHRGHPGGRRGGRLRRDRGRGKVSARPEGGGDPAGDPLGGLLRGAPRGWPDRLRQSIPRGRRHLDP